MSVAKKLALIAAGYLLAVVGGFVAVEINEHLMPADISQGSGGMVAFGDMILFVLVTGFLGLVPTFFLIKLWLEKSPHSLFVSLLAIAALGPVSWLLVKHLASGPSPTLHQAAWQLLGPFIAFIGIPRMVFGPVLLVIEAIAFVLVRQRLTRALLVAAMLMDIVPLGLFALHMARVTHY